MSALQRINTASNCCNTDLSSETYLAGLLNLFELNSDTCQHKSISNFPKTLRNVFMLYFILFEI